MPSPLRRKKRPPPKGDNGGGEEGISKEVRYYTNNRGLLGLQKSKKIL
jgi:hypothetical protein